MSEEGQDPGLRERLSRQGEEALGKIAEELAGNPMVTGALSRALEAREKDFGLTPLGWTLYGSLKGWYAESGDYAGVLELLLDAGATAPPLTPEVKATEAVLAVLRRLTTA